MSKLINIKNNRQYINGILGRLEKTRGKFPKCIKLIDIHKMYFFYGCGFNQETEKDKIYDCFRRLLSTDHNEEEIDEIFKKIKEDYTDDAPLIEIKEEIERLLDYNIEFVELYNVDRKDKDFYIGIIGKSIDDCKNITYDKYIKGNDKYVQLLKNTGRDTDHFDKLVNPEIYILAG